jgi:hypothetical protein
LNSSYRHDKPPSASFRDGRSRRRSAAAFGQPASATSEPAIPAILRYFDVAVLVIAAPILLAIGVPAAGYGVAAGAWIALRGVGVGVERVAGAARDQRSEVSLRLGYMLGRLFALAATVILVRQDVGRDDGLAALLVIVVAFTMQLAVSAMTRPRAR